MTVLEQVGIDIRDGRVYVLFERPPAPCAICRRVLHLRYGCCLPCSKVTNVADERIRGYPRVGGIDP